MTWFLQRNDVIPREIVWTKWKVYLHEFCILGEKIKFCKRLQDICICDIRIGSLVSYRNGEGFLNEESGDFLGVDHVILDHFVQRFSSVVNDFRFNESIVVYSLRLIYTSMSLITLFESLRAVMYLESL